MIRRRQLGSSEQQRAAKRICVQNEAFSDLMHQIEEQASLIKACHLTGKEWTKIMTDMLFCVEEKVKHQETRGLQQFH